MKTFKETPEYKSYAAFNDWHLAIRILELAEAAIEAAYNLGLTQTKIEPPAQESCKFECPECGSYKFGTSNCTSPATEWVGNCHGYGCHFEWPRTDDVKYGLGHFNVD